MSSARARAFVQTLLANLEPHRSKERADWDVGYLKSDLEHLGVIVPTLRKEVRALAKRELAGHDDLVAVATLLWSAPVYERRHAAMELLSFRRAWLGPDDLDLLERLLRESKTWALVDHLAEHVVGSVIAAHPKSLRVLDRWAKDDDFWLRRSALLALLGPLKRGGGEWERFTRYADAMLDEKEFFIRKAIGWLLRETAKKRPALVAEWTLAHAQRMSGVTLKEALKRISDADRAKIAKMRTSA